jgi:hypothetical protein
MPTRGAGNSVAYLWGRDFTLNTFQGIINFGEGRLKIIENLNDDLIGIIYPHTPPPSLYQPSATKLIIKGYFGGSVQTIKELAISSLLTLSSYKVKSNNRLYFILDTDCPYVVGKNKGGSYIVTKDRYFYNGTSVANIQGIAIIGLIMWRAFNTIGGVFTLMRSKTSSLTYTAISTYRTTINPCMPEDDRTKLKQLQSVQLTWEGIAASGTAVLKYSIDGSSFTTIISESNTAAELAKLATAESDGTPFNQGREFQFEVQSTGGAKIKEIKYKYIVLPEPA